MNRPVHCSSLSRSSPAALRRVQPFSGPARRGFAGDPARPGYGLQHPLRAELRGMSWPGGKGGAAIPLGDPVFLAIADDAAIRRTAANGVPGTPMPAFAQSAGGMLTDEQIDAIVGGIRSWAKPDALRGDILPPYAAQTPGDPRAGPKSTRRTARPATARMAGEARRPVPLWMAHISPW